MVENVCDTMPVAYQCVGIVVVYLYVVLVGEVHLLVVVVRRPGCCHSCSRS